MIEDYIFCEYQASDWDNLRYHLQNLENWIFRGQSNSSWNLSTSLERSVLRYNYDSRATVEKEKVILEKFQRRASNYLNNIPFENNYLEWFSIIQHFGGPTRLLDFTHSLYVSAFFSVESTENDSAIYCLNRPLIDHVGLIREDERGSDILATFGTARYCDFVIQEGKRSPLVMVSEPQFLNERISAQQGIFAIPFEVNQKFEYNLGNTMNPNSKDLPKTKVLKMLKGESNQLNQNCILLKIVLPKKLHVKIRKDLSMMNINAATLFPGLDGFARSLHLEFDKQETNDFIEFSKAISNRLK